MLLFCDNGWIEEGEKFIVFSEKDGWRQIFRVARDGSSMTNITPGAYDVVRIRRIDTEAEDTPVAARPTVRETLDAGEIGEIFPLDRNLVQCLGERDELISCAG